MEIKFFAENGALLDLSNEKISVQESNSMMSDQLFSKFMFPFEKYIDDNFLENFGDFISYDVQGLDTSIEGQLFYENKTQAAILNILSIEGKKITGQIDFGLTEIPNFNKQLSELPLEKFSVTDIHTFAKDICDKIYPATNFNFPRIYTSKYSPDTEMWSAFDGYYNDLKTDGSEMRRNYIDVNGDVFNINIIHPTPHILYLLKEGFKDAGFILKGDVLTDPVLRGRWVFSNTKYFSSANQRKLNVTVNSLDYYDLQYQRVTLGGTTYRMGHYREEITLEKTGNYTINGKVRIVDFDMFLNNHDGIGEIKLNGVRIWYKKYSHLIDEIINIKLNITKPNSKLEFYARSNINFSEEPFDVYNINVFSDVLELTNEPDEESGVVNNINEIDLSKAVPQMTFGELYMRIKNWFNYDLTPKGNEIYMNKIVNISNEVVQDFQFSEQTEPKRTKLKQRSYLHKFVDLDNGEKKNSMYFDKTGQLLNGTPKTDTNIIEVDGYAMPIKIPKPGGYNTANVMRDTDSCLALVYYNGLTSGQNNATNPPGCDHPELFDEYWYNWLSQRLNSDQFEWPFLVNTEQFFPFSIKNRIYAFNNVHLIKEWVKEKVGDNTYEVQIITETVV